MGITKSHALRTKQTYMGNWKLQLLYTRKHGDNINQTKASLRHTATANAIVINKQRGLKRKSEEKYSFKLFKKVSCYKWMFLSD